MKLSICVFCSFLFALNCLGDKKSGIEYVDPFIGTGGTGHCHPCATSPFGIVQAGADTGRKGWTYCGGYQFNDSRVILFSQTHISGTGVPDCGDVAFLPFCENYDYLKGSSFQKKNEKASVGYYSVKLDEAKADVEITATPRVAFYKIKYNADGGKIYLDLLTGITSRKPRVWQEKIDMPDKFTINGEQRVLGWVPMRSVCFSVKFDKPIVKIQKLKNPKNEMGSRYVIDFGLKKGEELKVKIGIATSNMKGAERNIAVEVPHWDFSKTLAETKEKWRELIDKFVIEADEKTKRIFYTSVYHLFIQPNNMADVDGYYDAPDNKTAKSIDGKYFTTLSLWDTYRAAHPLYTILIPDEVAGFVNTMLMHHDVVGYLPVWCSWGKENHCMIGNHSISVIGEAIMKNLKGFDYQKAFKAIVESSTIPHYRSEWNEYVKYGYFPHDINIGTYQSSTDKLVNARHYNPKLIKLESVSSTLEAVYNDYCVYKVAQKLGDKKVEAEFKRRSQFYKNLFCPETKFMRARDKAGNWRTPFNPFDYTLYPRIHGDYTEASAWQYTWHVQQDVEGLIELFGSKEAFCEKLNQLFTVQDSRDFKTVKKSHDISGLIGQYVHGNEPSHHIAYMFAIADQPRRTQELVREICDKMYDDTPLGLCGNDDCGQMSAWYIFSAMGFYPVNPCGAEYVLGAPQMSGATINLDGGKKFVIKANNFSRKAKYVKSVKLNGKPYTKKTISHNDIMQGGELVFDMCE